MTQIGRYDIVRRTGRTPLGTLYEAVDRETRRTVSLQASEEQCSESLGRLQHPNIRSLIATEQTDGQIFLVLEHLDARPLTEFVAARQSGPVEIIRLLKAAAAALDHAQANGVSHPGLTPCHLLVNQDGLLKVAGFELPGLDALPGSAPISDAEREELEASVPYRPAEFLAGEQETSRAAQFSLGAIAVEALTGRRAFDAPSPFGIMAGLLRGKPADLAPVEAKFNPGIRRVLERMLASDPEMRYATCAQAIEALEGNLRREAAAPTRVSNVPAPDPVAPSVVDFVRVEKQRKKNQLRWIIAATVLTALAMLILVVSQMMSHGSKASPGPVVDKAGKNKSVQPTVVTPPPSPPPPTAKTAEPSLNPQATNPKPLKRRTPVKKDTTPGLLRPDIPSETTPQ